MFPLLVDNLKSEDYFYAQKRNMKKKTVLKLLFITSCLVAVCSLFYNNETSTLDSLAFQNVEALAQGENDWGNCTYYGCIVDFSSTCNVYSSIWGNLIKVCPNMRG